jgi:hypothetical protein
MTWSCACVLRYRVQEISLYVECSADSSESGVSWTLAPPGTFSKGSMYVHGSVRAAHLMRYVIWLDTTSIPDTSQIDRLSPYVQSALMPVSPYNPNSQSFVMQPSPTLRICTSRFSRFCNMHRVSILQSRSMMLTLGDNATTLSAATFGDRDMRGASLMPIVDDAPSIERLSLQDPGYNSNSPNDKFCEDFYTTNNSFALKPRIHSR